MCVIWHFKQEIWYCSGSLQSCYISENCPKIWSSCYPPRARILSLYQHDQLGHINSFLPVSSDINFFLQTENLKTKFYWNFLSTYYVLNNAFVFSSASFLSIISSIFLLSLPSLLFFFLLSLLLLTSNFLNPPYHLQDTCHTPYMPACSMTTNYYFLINFFSASLILFLKFPTINCSICKIDAKFLCWIFHMHIFYITSQCRLQPWKSRKKPLSSITGSSTEALYENAMQRHR